MSLIIGVAGGSCSGKTTLINHSKSLLGEDACAIVRQDDYYYDHSRQFDFDGGAVNFDHPNSIDFELLYEQLLLLKQGQSIQMPVYDFATHSRLEKTRELHPRPIILVDGILILTQPQLRDVFDHSIYIECDAETRLERRMCRDVKERGRTKEGVIEQFRSQVEPMHGEFVDPSKQFANEVVSQSACSEQISAKANCITNLYMRMIVAKNQAESTPQASI